MRFSSPRALKIQTMSGSLDMRNHLTLIFINMIANGSINVNMIVPEAAKKGEAEWGEF
jgi:hypothetical protein